MSPVLKWLASGGAMILIGAAPAAAGLNVAVVAAPATADTPEPTVIERVLRMVMTAVAEQGHAVFDATAIESKKTVSAPLDAVILVSVKTSLKRGAYTSHLQTRLGATLIDGRSGRHLAHVDVTPLRQRRVAARCGKTCLADFSARDAAASSGRLGAEIARRLAKIERRPVVAAATPTKPKATPPRPPAYVLAFRGLATGDLPEIEQYLSVFPGFRDLRREDVTSVEPGRTTYRYGSDLDRPALDQALLAALRHMRLGARITQSGRTLVIDATQPDPGDAATNTNW